MRTETEKFAQRMTKKVMILEPHLDDFEVGLSVWLKKMANYKIEIHLVTFCSGRPNEEVINQERLNKRLENLEFFKKEYPNISIYNHRMNFGDTTLEDYSIGYLINCFYELFEKYISGYVSNLDFFKEFYITQSDLHPDHEIINKIGKILTRTFKGKVFEYIIRNSDYSNNFNYNTEIKTEYDWNSENHIAKFITPCLYPTEKIYYQNIVHVQKSYDGKYISDKLNLIKDVFVASDRI